MWRYDPTSYKVGDPIFVSYSRGWSKLGVTRYVVKRITPTGQIVAASETRKIKLTKRGELVGQSGYHRCHVVSESRARELLAEQRMDAIWTAIRDAGAAIERAAAKQDDEALDVQMAALASAIEARRAATGTGAVHESAAHEVGDAQ